MKKLGILFGAALIVVATPLAAQQTSDEEAVAVNGSVAGLCVLGTPSRNAVDLGQLIAVSGARVGRMAALGSQQVTLPGSFCNFAGTALTVSAQAMLAADTNPVQPGFARAVNFTSTVGNWSTQDATVATAATAGGATPNAQAAGGTHPAPRIADLTLTLSGFSAPSDLLLVAGAYSGSVTITLGPAATPAAD